MSVTAQERQDLETEYGSKVVEEAIALMDPVERKGIPEKMNKDQVRLLIETCLK